MLYAERMVGETGQRVLGPKLAARFVGFTILLIVASVVIARLFAWLFGGDLSAWVQAVGAILAILSGFATMALQTEAQRQLDENEMGQIARAAHVLAFEARQTVSDRLNSALTPSGPGKLYALHGDRTTEIVNAMREFDTGRLPGDILLPFIRLRSHVYATNCRITEIFESEEEGPTGKREKTKAGRKGRLKSCVRVRHDALPLFKEIEDIAVARFASHTKTVQTGIYLSGYDVDGSETDISAR